MTIFAYILFAVILGLIILLIIKQKKDNKEDLHYKKVTFKALRLDELQDIIADPSKSENLRDGARNEIQRRRKNNLL